MRAESYPRLIVSLYTIVITCSSVLPSCRCRCCKPITIAMEFFICPPRPPLLSLSLPLASRRLLYTFLHAFVLSLDDDDALPVQFPRLCISSSLESPFLPPSSLVEEVTGTWPRFNRNLPREIRIIYKRARITISSTRSWRDRLLFLSLYLLFTRY